MSFHVLDPGIASRVVDLGRRSTRGLGIPVGGAADRSALALGNALVGNAEGAAALEVCLKGPVLRAEAQLGCVVFGSPFTLASARQSLRAGTSFTLEAGEEIHIGTTSQGMRAYLCVRGAFTVPVIMGSMSGLDALRAGDKLPCDPGSVRRRFLPPSVLDELHKDRRNLRAIPGLQADWFEESSLFEQEFTVTPALDRMGVRLEGRPLQVLAPRLSSSGPEVGAGNDSPERELVSEPVCPGAVQVTRDGQCIILGVDGQTIGGYPKIAQIIQADLDHLGQLRPGDKIRFRQVKLADAVELFGARHAFVHEWVMRARISLDAW
jgi:antagonist of KipI